jgi:4-hydroxy-L-threonine phosphate dehydrogenase PdxA
MKFKPIIIVPGEPNSVFFEIFFKSLKNNKFKSPIILVTSRKLFERQAKYFKSKITINEINYSKNKINKIYSNSINLINVKYSQKKIFQKISDKSNIYIKNCFDIALDLLEKKISNKFLNGPISKKFFLKKNFSGITEYLAKKTNTKNVAMVIYNKSLSVSPITTHLPIKFITNKITKLEIINKIKIINLFWYKHFNFKPKIAVTGLNPHCESLDKFNEDEKIIKPAVNYLKKLKYKIKGPFPADTIFLKANRKKFNIIIGMYHDQVLTPAKTLFEYDAINITAGLPFSRVSPDHGPNEEMLGKNLSNHLSLLKSIQFLDF